MKQKKNTMESMSSFAIVTRKAQATLVISVEGADQKIEVQRGTMVEVLHSQSNQQYCKVIIHDYHERNLAYENNLYFMRQSELFPVNEIFWPFLIAITNPNERANIAMDDAYVTYLLNLNIKSFVSVVGQYFINTIRESIQFLPERQPKEHLSTDYACIIRYIGPVDEIGPGNFFGLELLVNFNDFPKIKHYAFLMFYVLTHQNNIKTPTEI